MNQSLRILVGGLKAFIVVALCVSCTKKSETPNTPAASNSGASSAESKGGLSNNEIKIGIGQEFENFNPLVSSMVATNYMMRMVLRNLVTISPEGKWIPVHAKEIPSVEAGTVKIVDVGGKKKLIANWEIIESATWGDGKPVICEDYALALKIAASPNVSIPEKEVYTQIEKIDSDPKNPKKCTFTYEKARWDFYQLGTLNPVPKHLEEAVFKKFASQKEGYEKNSLYTKDPTNPGLFNGPFVISEIQLGDHVTFVQNAKYLGTPAKIKKIIVKLIPNTGTMEANLRSGTIDLISNLGLALDQALAFDKKIKAENLPYTVLYQPSATYEHIDLNLDNPILKDLRVRKALVLAMNREDLINALFEGKQTAAVHFITPKDPWYTADPTKISIYKYSKRDAEKLLDEAGWKIGPDGYRYQNGKKLSLVFMTTAGNKTRELVQVYLQNQWKQVGIEVVAKNEPARVFFGETLKKRKFESMVMYAWVSSPENNPKASFHTKNIPSEKNGYSGQNQMGWSNKEVDAQLEKLDLEFKHENRIAIMQDVLKAYTTDIPVLPLYYRSDVAVVPTKLKNYVLTGHQFPETNDVEKWTTE